MTGSDSPVSADWSTSHRVARPAAAHPPARCRPVRIRITSPGTSSRDGGVTHFPSRRTRHLTASWAFSASMALPAWCSSQNPTAALATSSSKMMKKSGQCRSTPDKITAASIIHGIGPQK